MFVAEEKQIEAVRSVFEPPHGKTNNVVSKHV